MSGHEKQLRLFTGSLGGGGCERTNQSPCWRTAKPTHRCQILVRSLARHGAKVDQLHQVRPFVNLPKAAVPPCSGRAVHSSPGMARANEQRACLCGFPRRDDSPPIMPYCRSARRFSAVILDASGGASGLQTADPRGSGIGRCLRLSFRSGRPRFSLARRKGPRDDARRRALFPHTRRRSFDA